MKKFNHKQLNWSGNKVFAARMKYLLGLFFTVALVFIVQSVVFAVADPDGIGTTVKMVIPVIILFTMADIGNITQPSDIETAGNQIGFKLWLIAREQIDDTVSFPSPNTARELATIPLIAGQYMHYFEGVENSIKYTGTAEKGDIGSTFGKTIPIILKYSATALNFVESFQGKGFVLIWQICESAVKEVVGSYCKPVTLRKFEVKEDSDGKYISLEFGNTHWRQPLIYAGSITLVAAATVAANATNLPIVAGNDNYRLSDHTGVATLVTVSGLASADYGRHITVLAPATVTNAPLIADNSVFILVDGETWTANPGSQIVFQILDDSTLVEVSRIQTA